MEDPYAELTKEEVVELLKTATDRAQQAEQRTQQAETILEILETIRVQQCMQ